MKKIKLLKNLILILLLTALLLPAGCGAAPEEEIPPAAEASSGEMPEDASPADGLPSGEAEIIPLDLDPYAAAPAQAEWTSVGELRITAAGTYRLSGTLEGRVVVDADGPAELILAGVALTGPECLQIRSGDPVTLTLAAGTNNTLSDGADSPDRNADAALSSKGPLTIQGEGTLAVTAGANNGIQGKGGITLAGGTVIVSAQNNGVKADGDLSVTGGQVTVFSGGDGLKADASRISPGTVSLRGGTVTIQAADRGVNAENTVYITGGSLTAAAEGDGVRGDTVDISGGDISIDAQGDGIQAAADLFIKAGTLAVRTGGGGGNAASHPGESFGPWGQSQSQSAADTVSTKGLKSDGSISISGGTISLDTADDAVHCAAVCAIDGGELTIVSSDDGIHADDMLVISDGAVRIEDCFEGLEAFAVEVRGGDTTIRAVNDGINANGSGFMFRQNSAAASAPTSASGASTTYFLMSGGRVDLVVTGNSSNQGDGVDSNGVVYITGGELIVSTFGSFLENGLDTGWGGPVVTGGKVIAGGSSSMSESFSSESTQCCAVVTMSYMPNDTEVTITDEDGNVIWSVVMADGFSCLQLSHPDLHEGHVYTLTYGSQTKTLDFTSTTNIGKSGGGFGRPF